MTETLDRMNELSKDAWAVLGAWFGIGRGCTLTFRMDKSRPTARAQKALDEIVKAGIIKSEPFNKYGGVTYIPIQEFDRRKALSACRKARDFTLTEPIA